ncbi:MAG: Hsp33 family molecular chaperone HslO [Kiritimatiellales bacterium]|nr:Hsp33 family molecular chaperone HslO [Kiritimatiellales bacterium]
MRTPKPLRRTLPIPERMELVQKKEPVKINCQFCNRHYELSIDDCIVAWNRKF